MAPDAGTLAGNAFPGEGPAAGNPVPGVAPPVLDPAVLDPAILDPAVLDPAVLDPAVLDPAVLDSAVLARDGRLTAGTGLPGGEPPGADLRQLRALGLLRGGAALLGPAFVAAVAYVDPGNFATNFSACAVSGYSLAWVIVAANLMAMLVQYLSAKAGVATGKDLPELCRRTCRRPPRADCGSRPSSSPWRPTWPSSSAPRSA